jgi:predicted transcriptional regulator
MKLKSTAMDLAVKKLELINWLTAQDEAMIKKIDELRKSSIESTYMARMSENIDAKLARSEADIKAGRTHSHEEVESYFKSKFSK